MEDKKSQQIIFDLAGKANTEISENPTKRDNIYFEPKQDEDNNTSPLNGSDHIDKMLRKKSGLQNLEERKLLLNILSRLFVIQLVFMNIIALIFSFWIIFDFPFFTSVNIEVLKESTSFYKYYISAVLVELLGAIVYVVRRVFSTKIHK